MTRDQKALLSKLPTNGEPVSNQALQRQLEWDSDRYYAVRKVLIDKGLVLRGRGRGGSIRLWVEHDVPSDPVSAPSRAAEKSEQILYQAMRDVICGEWAEERNIRPLAVEITAHQGIAATGGKWSRPDIVSVEVRTFPYVPGTFLEVVTFEIKPVSAINVVAVYEALAHRRAATHSYVLLHVPSGEEGALQEAISQVVEVGQEHGVGVITVGDDPSDYSHWTEYVEARRADVDPERLNEFITTQLSDETRELIRDRLR